MVRDYGMSERLGPVGFSGGAPQYLGTEEVRSRSYADETQKVIDEEVAKLCRAGLYDRAVAVAREAVELADLAHETRERANRPSEAGHDELEGLQAVELGRLGVAEIEDDAGRRKLDRSSPVSHYEAPFAFTGGLLRKVTVRLGPMPVTDGEGIAAAEMARQ